MSHLASEQLWDHARGELPAEQAQQAERHLAGCADCRVALEDVRGAQQALVALPPPPPLPDAVARRVGHRLAELADAKAARAFAPWWHGLFTVRFALATATALALVLAGAWLLAPGAPAGLPPTPVALPTPLPPPEAAPTPAPPKAPAAKLTAVVASAKKATATKQQVLAEGAKVSTAAGGSAWLKLPDGSRAGLTGTSEVTLATLEAGQLTLDLGRGNLALEVPHREDRVFVVRAGELEVKDLGTRFLVSRQADRTLVAVEEGVVEVKAPTGTRELRAGRAMTWRNGQLQEFAWEAAAPPPQPTARAVPPAAPSHPDSVARLAEEDDDEEGDLPPPAEEAPLALAPEAPDRTPVVADEQWAQLPPAERPTLAPTAPTKRTRRGFSLRGLERKLRELSEALTTPPQGEREARAKAVTRAADAGDCEHALTLAERWLRATPSSLAQEPQLRRGVQLQQLRCLNHLGRGEEASALQRALETAH